MPELTSAQAHRPVGTDNDQQETQAGEETRKSCIETGFGNGSRYQGIHPLDTREHEDR